jgi:Uma2 family endonuclease
MGAYNWATRTSREASVAITGRRLTLEDFLALPEEKPALEYADGEVTQKVAPQFKHSRSQRALLFLVNMFGVPRKLASAEVELRVTFAGRSYVPDVSVFVWERIPSDDRGYVPNEVTIPPDIAVEIASPDQSIRGQVERCRWLVANGVRVSLLLNPEDRLGPSVRVFRPDDEVGPLRGADRVDLDDVIPGFSFTVDELFADLRARPGQ